MSSCGQIKRYILNTPLFTVRNLLLLVLVGSVVVFTFYARINVSSELAYINVPFYLALVLLAFRFHGKVGVLNAVLWAVGTCMFLFAEIFAGVGWKDILKFFFLYCAPLLACQLSFGRGGAKGFARTIIRIFNAGVLSVFFILVLDLVSGSAVMGFLTSKFMPEMTSWISAGLFERHASIWGHYLITAGFYLVFLFVNVAYAKVEGEYLIDVRILYVVATLGVLSTGGKTALVIYLVSIVWINLTSRHGVRNAAALTAFLLALYYLGAFDIVLERFGADDLSSGRNDSTRAMFSAELPRLIGGCGERFSAHTASLIGTDYASMFAEYSLLALCYKFGIVYVGLACILLLWPAFSIARATGNWTIAFMGVMTLVYFSTFNGLVTMPDTYLLMALFGICCNSLNQRSSLPKQEEGISSESGDRR